MFQKQIIFVQDHSNPHGYTVHFNTEMPQPFFDTLKKVRGVDSLFQISGRYQLSLFIGLAFDPQQVIKDFAKEYLKY